MVDEKEVAEAQKDPPEEKGGDGNTTPVLVLLLVVPLLLVSCFVLYFFASYQPKPDNNVAITEITSTPTPESSLITSSTNQLEDEEVLEETLEVVKPSQPNCTNQYHMHQVLEELSAELFVKKLMCTPEDFHDLDKHKNPRSKVEDPRGHMVIYIVVGLLLTSLVAAFVDVYKVKGKKSKSKPQLTKRCSLADLTVLRHSRRESMRKDSIVDEQRNPLKLLGARPPSEHRRCSYPLYPGEVPYGYGRVSPRHLGSRKTSMVDYSCDDEMYSYDYHHNRVVRLIRRF